MKKTTLLMIAVLAVATVLAAGSAILPDSVQNAEANPCEVTAETSESEIGTNCEFGGPVIILE